MIRQLLVFTVGLMCVAPAGIASAQAVNRTAVQSAIVAKEKAVSDSFVTGDRKAFHAEVASDGIAVDGAGITKAADFDTAMAGYKMSGYTISDSSFLWLDDTNVVHTYKFIGKNVTYKGQPVPSDSWSSTVWSNKGGKWSAMFHQESVIMPSPAAAAKPAAAPKK